MALKEEKTAVSAVFSFYWMLFANPKPRRSAYPIRLRGTHRANFCPMARFEISKHFFRAPKKGL